MAVLSLLLITTDSRRAVVSDWRKYVHLVLDNPIGGLSLSRNSVSRLTDCTQHDLHSVDPLHDLVISGMLNSKHHHYSVDWAIKLQIKQPLLSTDHYHHLISSQSHNLGHGGTTDDVAAILFHPSLSPAALRESPNPIPIHSLKLSFRLFFCPPLLLAPFTVPCRIVFTMLEDLEMWPYHLSFRFFTMVRRSSCTPIAFWILLPHGIVDVQKSPIASHLKGLDPSLNFCCQGSALTGIKEGG